MKMPKELENTDDEKDTEDNNSESISNKNSLLNEEKKEKFGKPVVIKADAYKTIILYASRYANQAIKPEDWKEIYGVLIGTTTNDLVIVDINAISTVVWTS